MAALKMAKLLLHRIPKNVPCEELHRILPGDFTVEVKVESQTSFSFSLWCERGRRLILKTWVFFFVTNDEMGLQ